jgi:hypothetical protein
VGREPGLSDRSLLPTFIVIGAMKAGTTSLHAYLRAHPQVFMTNPKEPNYFAEELSWSKGLDWYLNLFAGSDGAVARGEASTNYSKFPRFPGVPERIAELLPDVKLVYVVRDPIERIRSQYLALASERGQHHSLDDILRADSPIVNLSMYRFQIDQYLAYFDESQMLVVTSESLRDHRARVLADVFDFIGVDPSFVPDDLVAEKNRTSDKYVDNAAGTRIRQLPGFNAMSRHVPLGLKKAVGRLTVASVDTKFDAAISDEVLAELRDRFRVEAAGLRPFLGPDFDGWGLLD